MVDRAQAVDEVGLGVIGLAGHAIEPLVGPQGYPAVVVSGLHQSLYGLMVARLGGADEIVVGDVEQLPGVPEPSTVNVRLFLRADPVGFRRALYFQPMLVCASQEEDILAEQTVPSGQGISRERGVGVANVRCVVDVIDRRSHIKAGHPPRVPGHLPPTRGL